MTHLADPDALARYMELLHGSATRPTKRWWQFWRRPRHYTHIWKRPHDPDGDGEGTWYRPFADSRSWCWRAPVVAPEDRCTSEECLFGREWIRCRKRRGHKGVHRNNETWGWDEGDERA